MIKTKLINLSWGNKKKGGEREKKVVKNDVFFFFANSKKINDMSIEKATESAILDRIEWWKIIHLA